MALFDRHCLAYGLANLHWVSSNYVKRAGQNGSIGWWKRSYPCDPEGGALENIYIILHPYSPGGQKNVSKNIKQKKTNVGVCANSTKTIQKRCPDLAGKFFWITPKSTDYNCTRQTRNTQNTDFAISDFRHSKHQPIVCFADHSPLRWKYCQHPSTLDEGCFFPMEAHYDHILDASTKVTHNNMWGTLANVFPDIMIQWHLMHNLELCRLLFQ